VPVVLIGLWLLPAACSSDTHSTLVAYPRGGGLAMCAVVADTNDVRTSTVAVLAVDGTEPVSLVGWTPTDVDGVNVVGVSVAPFAQTGGGAGLKGFPRENPASAGATYTGLTNQPIPVPPASTALDPDNPPVDTGMTVLVGIQLAPGRQEGTLGGLALEYRDGSGARHTLTTDTELRLSLTPGACTL
jgi:hypothetical protein